MIQSVRAAGRSLIYSRLLPTSASRKGSTLSISFLNYSAIFCGARGRAPAPDFLMLLCYPIFLARGPQYFHFFPHVRRCSFNLLDKCLLQRVYCSVWIYFKKLFCHPHECSQTKHPLVRTSYRCRPSSEFSKKLLQRVFLARVLPRDRPLLNLFHRVSPSIPGAPAPSLPGAAARSLQSVFPGSDKAQPEVLWR